LAGLSASVLGPLWVLQRFEGRTSSSGSECYIVEDFSYRSDKIVLVRVEHGLGAGVWPSIVSVFSQFSFTKFFFFFLLKMSSYSLL
jgi:hypothetical protein